jgi:hypothetical protein
MRKDLPLPAGLLQKSRNQFAAAACKPQMGGRYRPAPVLSGFMPIETLERLNSIFARDNIAVRIAGLGPGSALKPLPLFV